MVSGYVFILSYIIKLRSELDMGFVVLLYPYGVLLFGILGLFLVSKTQNFVYVFHFMKLLT